MSGASGVPWAVPGYAEERELGRGASGRVVAAVHVASGARVAVKYLSPRLLATPGFLEAFRSEAALLRSLSVPSVVRLFDYAEAPGQGAAIVMELVDGASLHEMISGQGPTGPESALLVLKGSLQGLAAAHALGIVHRDYKPENVLVDGSGQSKLTDFGVAVRAGQDASVSGTPLYMAPEQWDGAPATPTTDIYAATAVFFECLTGQPPFSGGLGQLAAQHASAAVPVELVDEPLRLLVARGMAKQAAARPSDASQFMTELEATALAAYGTGWEDRGRAHLAERAAALLLLLLPHGGAAAGAGTGTTTASTWLPGAKAAAVKGGLAGWQLAVISAGVAVTVAAAVVGGGTLVKKLASAAPAATSSQRAPAAAAAGPDPAVCGSSPAPPIAYATFTGTAQAPTGGSVVVRCGTGTPRTLGPGGASPAGAFYAYAGPAWSSDGTQLGWATGSAVYVAQANAGTWLVRHWACRGCSGLAFLGQQAVSVSQQAAGGPPASTAIPQLLVFPATGSGPPATLPVTGITTVGVDTEFRVMGSISPSDVVVDYGDAGGNDGGGTQLLYHVDAAGHASQYGNDTVRGSTYPNAPVGFVGTFTANQSGSEITFRTSSSTSAFCFGDTTWALDPETGAITRPKTPAGGGPDGWLVQGMWVDQSGTPYVSLVPNLSNCTTNTSPSGGAEPVGVAPIVCRLSSGSWVPTGRGVFQAAYGPGSWLAEETGVTTQNDFHPETLTISNGNGTTPVTVANVSAFAWAP